MISLGMWACRYRELRPISFGIGGEGTKVRGNKIESELEVDEHIRGGRGRGRNRDEGPSYEMVGRKEGNGEAV